MVLAHGSASAVFWVRSEVVSLLVGKVRYDNKDGETLELGGRQDHLT